MIRENRKYWNGPETNEIISYLTGKGFSQTEETERYYTFEDESGNEIYFDFDPYMHIDETDDEICYDRPVYAFYRNWDYSDYDTPVSNFAEFESVLSDVQKYLHRFDEDDDE